MDNKDLVCSLRYHAYINHLIIIKPLNMIIRIPYHDRQPFDFNTTINYNFSE